MRRIVLVLALLLVVAMGSAVYAADVGIRTFKVNPYGSTATDMGSIS